MEKLKKVGNITVYYTKNGEKDYTIELYNGLDCIYKDSYFTSDLLAAVDKSLLISCDICTQEFVNSVSTKRYSDNTYGIVNVDEQKQDWFCRIDNTNYFKHFYESENDFIKDKNSRRIIDY